MSGIEKTVKTDSSDSVAEHHDTDMGSSAATRLAEAERGVEALHEACTTYYIRNKKLPISLDRLLEGNEPVLKSDKDLYDPWVNK